MLQHRIRSPLKGTSLGHEHNGKFLFFSLSACLFWMQFVDFLSQKVSFCCFCLAFWYGSSTEQKQEYYSLFFPASFFLPPLKKKNTLSIWSKDFIVALEFSLGCLCTFHGPSQQLSLKCFQMQSCTETLQCQGSKELDLLILGVHAENAGFI